MQHAITLTIIVCLSCSAAGGLYAGTAHGGKMGLYLEGSYGDLFTYGTASATAGVLIDPTSNDLTYTRQTFSAPEFVRSFSKQFTVGLGQTRKVDLLLRLDPVSVTLEDLGPHDLVPATDGLLMCDRVHTPRR